MDVNWLSVVGFFILLILKRCLRKYGREGDRRRGLEEFQGSSHWGVFLSRKYIKMVNDRSSIHIYWWMLWLGLNLSELMVYATIFSFTNWTSDHCYRWSASYLWEWCQVQKRSVYRILSKLEEMWLVQKKERYINWVKFMDYYTNYGDATKVTGDDASVTGDDVDAPGEMTWVSSNIYRVDNNRNNSSINTTIEEYKPKEITVEINNLIASIKQVCKENHVAYDKTRERMFAKHILTAAEFWEFAESIGQGREEFAGNVIIASIKAWYWKWPLTWPMKIYQNYADLYNWAKSKFEKKVTPHIEVL